MMLAATAAAILDDGLGAYCIVGRVAVIVIPCSIATIHVHAVLAIGPARLTLFPVCVRAAAVVH